MMPYIEIAIDVAIAYLMFYFFGWIGFALAAFFVVALLGGRLINSQRLILRTLLSRLPDRCAFCHREIVDEGGILDEDSIYHEKCVDKLESLESLRKEAGVPISQAIHLPRSRTIGK